MLEEYRQMITSPDFTKSIASDLIKNLSRGASPGLGYDLDRLADTSMEELSLKRKESPNNIQVVKDTAVLKMSGFAREVAIPSS
jgi:hypothetical protein